MRRVVDMKPWISVALVCVVLSACVTPSTILHHEGDTMVELMSRASDDEHTVPEPIGLREGSLNKQLDSYTRISANEIKQLFPLLPNPTITIYVYPHLSTKHRAPVPGYTTAINLYERDEYALPSEYRYQVK